MLPEDSRLLNDFEDRDFAKLRLLPYGSGVSGKHPPFRMIRAVKCAFAFNLCRDIPTPDVLSEWLNTRDLSVPVSSVLSDDRFATRVSIDHQVCLCRECTPDDLVLGSVVGGYGTMASF